jgi:replication initiation protein RepC
LWADGCHTLGRHLAAVALAIVSTKPPEHFTTGPGGYFYGMIAKAKVDALHLDRSVWKLHGRRLPLVTDGL